ncbi:MCE family protein [Nocardia nova]|jgi:phospholipid/cholesterol/gamma-HCH transport system substrate-binding protein|uniref:MCE family protein n=1 Tax=Nocardia nova TaxID=37330 RepID=UPI0007C84004|nr:MCE family protein [Nocardia nova]
MRRVRKKKALSVSLGLLATTTVLAGCGRFDGVNSLPLPGNASKGSGFDITVDMPNVQNLVNNSVVKSGNVDVGTVSSIRLDGWHARLTVQLNDSAALPANVSATLGQTSILGAQYLELSVPSGQQPATRSLRAGDVIGLERSGEYPSTDRVLSALSGVLNGGGLEQIRTIVAEADSVLDGRENNLRDLIDNLDTFVTSLNNQRDDIVRAIESVDKLSGTLGAQTATIDKGLATLAPAFGVLDKQQRQLTDTLASLGRFGQVANEVLTASHTGLVDDLTNLRPVLTELAAAGANLPKALDLAATIPFPVSTIDRAIRGDFINLYLTLDLSANGVLNKILPSMPKGLLESVVAIGHVVDPMIAPTQAPPPADAAPPAVGVPPQPPALPALPSLPGLPGLFAPPAPAAGGH